MRLLTRPLLFVLAVVFLIEAWLWTHLEPVVARVIAHIPLRALKKRIAQAIEGLSPAATLIVFVVPGVLLFPLKLLTIWLIAQKQLLLAGVIFTFAKLVGLGVTAFVFEATRPKLLQIAWFRRLYDWVISVVAWAHALVDPIKKRIRRAMHVFAPRHAGRTLRLLKRIRARMHAEAGVKADAPGAP